MKCRINRGKTAGETGTVKWIGQLPDAPHDDFIGIELDAPNGKHDGQFDGARYFKCKRNHGIFVRFSKITYVWR